ncbi:Rieske 2Fe-2S domain-containing protein [Aquabacterium sp. J223]|uniref:Rieske 2Fe-2S domain-containing protein n=1 Tax=Aquabacterium sp. J223 TaxID=2898431 RepID=UPI0039175455
MPVQVLGERLALFRDRSGQLGLVDDRCAHRGTSLSAGDEHLKTSGRVDDDGVRCPYHGWLYDRTGQCRQQPGEAPGRDFSQRIRIKAYPVMERHGFVWAYMGPGDAPELPDWDVLARQDGLRINALGTWPCNYFQVLENMVDPVHVSVLHLETDFDQDRFRAMPTLRVETTRWGLKTVAGRPGYEREVEFLMPGGVRLGVPMKRPLALAFWVVPVSDTLTASFHTYFMPLPEDIDDAERARCREQLEAFVYELDQRDPLTAATKVNAQDKFACYSQGEVADRSLENLGGTDAGVALLRRTFFTAIDDVQSGRDPRGVVREPGLGMVRFENVF